MRTFRGGNLKSVPPELIPHFRGLIEWTGPASRALSNSIQKKNNPAAVVVPPPETPPNPNPATEFLDSQFRVKNFSILSKQLAFNCNSIPGSTLVTLTVPAVSGTIALLTNLPALPLTIANGGTGQTTAQSARLALLPSVTGNTLKFLRVNAAETDVEWAIAAGTHNLLSATHPDTVVGSPARGDLIVGNSTPAWQKKAKGGRGDLLSVDANDVIWIARGGTGTFARSDGTDTLFTAIAAIDLPSHDSTKHDNRTRRVLLPIGAWDNSAKANTGTEPNTAANIQLTTGVTRTHIMFRVPADYVSGPIFNMYFSTAGVDATPLTINFYTKKLVSNTTDFTAAYDNLDAITAVPSGTTNRFMLGTGTISTSIAAGDVLRFTLERDGVTDGNLNIAYFFGGDFEYTADM